MSTIYICHIWAFFGIFSCSLLWLPIVHNKHPQTRGRKQQLLHYDRGSGIGVEPSREGLSLRHHHVWARGCSRFCPTEHIYHVIWAS